MAVVHLVGDRTSRIEWGHPWVYRTEIREVEGEFEPGDIVDVVNHHGRFLGRGYINPTSMISVRMLTRQKEEIDGEFIRRRVESAWSLRRDILNDEHTDSCRVVFGESDFLPGLIVDKFSDYLVIQTLALGIERLKDRIVDALDDIVRPKGIYERNDAPVRGLEGLGPRTGWVKGEFDPVVIIRENGLRLHVDIARGQKTGYFLDQRENRAAIRNLARGARVLDCFCYTGSFSLHAAMYGAREVIGIDASDEAVSMAGLNAFLNGFDRTCSFVTGNVFDELRGFERMGRNFDLIILDPPAFARSRNGLEGAVRGYKEINLRAMRILSPGGFLVTCSCSYHVPEPLFVDIVREAARDARRTLRLLQMRRQASDHPILLGYDESYYLKCMILQVL